MHDKGYTAVDKARILLTTDYIDKPVTFAYNNCIMVLLIKFLTDTWYVSLKGQFTCSHLSLFTHKYFKDTYALYRQALSDTDKALAGTHIPVVKSSSNFAHAARVQALSYL